MKKVTSFQKFNMLFFDWFYITVWNFKSFVNLVMKLFNFKVQLLYTGSYGSALVKHKTLRMRFFKKVYNGSKNYWQYSKYIQGNVYMQSERDRPSRFRVLRQNLNTQSSSSAAGGGARCEGISSPSRPASQELSNLVRYVHIYYPKSVEKLISKMYF